MDLAELARRVSLVDLIAPQVRLRRQGREWIGLCPFHAEKTPSFTVVPQKGFWHCFGCGRHGNAIGWMIDYHRLDFKDAVARLADGAGLTGIGPEPDRTKARARARADAADRRRRGESAAGIWRAAVPIIDTLAARYLEARGIERQRLPGGVWPSVLRYAPALRHAPSGRSLPAMVAALAVQDARTGRGRFSGLHRTWLTVDGSAKAAVAKAKMMLGEASGAAIRLAPSAPTLALAEGIETALSVMCARPGLPCWAAGSLGAMARVVLPAGVREVVLCMDNDSDPAALARAVAAAKRFYRRRAVLVAWPPRGRDFNDVWREWAA